MSNFLNHAQVGSQLRLRAKSTWALLSVLALALFLCFWNLGAIGVQNHDEANHVRATQSMLHSGDWFTPRVNGKPYLSKPPLKMWLAAICAEVFGDSNFAHRFIDALCGVLITLLAAVLALHLTNSSWAALAAGSAILGAESLMFLHGFRSANQDAMLGLLTQLALFCGYLALTPEDSVSTLRRKKSALACGVLTGMAIMVKSAGGLLAFIVLAAFYLTSRHPRHYLKLDFSLLPRFILPALILPACFFVPHLLFTPNAVKVIFFDEVANRVLEGYHNQNEWTLYLKRIVILRLTLPPELMGIGLLSGVLRFIRTRSWVYWMLLCAALVPLLFYSLIPSRLTWYISPALPSFAVLIGLSVADALAALKSSFKRGGNYSPGGSASPVVKLLLICFLSWCALALAFNLDKIGRRVIFHPAPLALDSPVEDLIQSAKINPQLKFFWGDFEWEERELASFARLRSVIESSRDLKLAKATLQNSSNLVVAVPNQKVKRFLALRPVGSYSTLRRSGTRDSTVQILSFLKDPPGDSFTAARHIYKHATHSNSFGIGFSKPHEIDGDTVRCLSAPHAEFALIRDSLLGILGGTLELETVLKGSAAANSSIELRLNQAQLGTIDVPPGRSTHRLEIPPKKAKSAKNVLVFDTQSSDAASSTLAAPICLKSLSIVLDQNSQLEQQGNAEDD